MAIPSSFVILDAVSGTVIDASGAVAVDASALTDDQRDALENGTDTDRLRLSDVVGVSLSLSAPAITGASTGSPAAYVPGCAVRYAPAGARGSRWIATIARGSQRADRFRASVPFDDGPDAAARAVVDRFNAANGADWRIIGSALSMDGGNAYAYPVGPAHLAPAI